MQLWLFLFINMYVFINVLRLKVIFFVLLNQLLLLLLFLFFSHKIIIHDNYFYRGAYTLQALLFSRPSFPFNFMFIFLMYCIVQIDLYVYKYVNMLKCTIIVNMDDWKRKNKWSELNWIELQSVPYPRKESSGVQKKKHGNNTSLIDSHPYLCGGQTAPCRRCGRVLISPGTFHWPSVPKTDERCTRTKDSGVLNSRNFPVVETTRVEVSLPILAHFINAGTYHVISLF